MVYIGGKEGKKLTSCMYWTYKHKTLFSLDFSHRDIFCKQILRIVYIYQTENVNEVTSTDHCRL